MITVYDDFDVFYAIDTFKMLSNNVFYYRLLINENGHFVVQEV